jgi:hypothetical protein
MKSLKATFTRLVDIYLERFILSAKMLEPKQKGLIKFTPEILQNQLDEEKDKKGKKKLLSDQANVIRILTSDLDHIKSLIKSNSENFSGDLEQKLCDKMEMLHDLMTCQLMDFVDKLNSYKAGYSNIAVFIGLACCVHRADLDEKMMNVLSMMI